MRKNNALSIFDEMDEMFEDLFPVKQTQMRSDIKESDEDYQIDIELPGFDKKEINISYDDKYLTVSASHKEEKEDKHHKYVSKERNYSSVKRSYYVGDIDYNTIKAKMDKGVLEILIPKKAITLPEENRILIE